MGQLDSKFWSDSKFDGTCPTVITNFCKPNLIKVYTCKDVSIGNYLDAHETVMTVMYKELAAVHSNASYSLREANRYSGKCFWHIQTHKLLRPLSTNILCAMDNITDK